MRGPARSVALCLSLLLTAVAAAPACGAQEAMPDHCPMSAMATAAGPAGCHSTGELSADCCDLRSASEPAQTTPAVPVQSPLTLGTPGLQLVPAPATANPVTSVVSRGPHAAERYRLFSALLL